MAETSLLPTCSEFEWRLLCQLVECGQNFYGDISNGVKNAIQKGDLNGITSDKTIHRRDILAALQYPKALYWYAASTAEKEQYILPSVYFKQPTNLAGKYAQRTAAVLQLGNTKNEVEEQTAELHATWNRTRVSGRTIPDEEAPISR